MVTEDDSNLSIGFDGQNFLVVYSSEPRTISEDGEDVYGRFISPVSGLAGDSFVIDQNNIPSSNPTATVFADDRYAVLFHESLATANAESWQIYARLVSTNGVVSGERIYIAGNETVAAQFPFMGWNGTNYLVALRESMPIPADNEDFIDTNGVIRARWFDAEMQPVSAWIDVTGVFGDNEAVLAAMVLPAHNGFALGIQTIDTNWIPVNVYGAYVEESALPTPRPSQFDSVSILRTLKLKENSTAGFEVDVSAPVGKTITVEVPTAPTTTIYDLQEDDGEYEYYDPNIIIYELTPMEALDARYPQGDYVLRLYADTEKTILEETLVVSFSDDSGGALPFPEEFPVYTQPVPSGGEIRAVPDQTYTWQAYGGTTGSATHMDFEITGTGEFDEDVAVYFTDIAGACSYTPSTIAAGTYDIELCFLFVQSEQTAGGTRIDCANERYSRHSLIVEGASPDDADGDGLPDAWEEQYYGSAGVDPGVICANGLNTVLEAYTAGLDPTDPDAWFGITGGNVENGTLSWNSVSGRVYSVWWSSDLMDEFQCIDSNILWSADGFTDTVHRADSTGFYKLEVRLAE
ncbi:MAG: hypothetical protein GXY61_09985 [Lentisphaerae bacterium]|nr:hypothetical protein [Lentisphaerota bacterium]